MYQNILNFKGRWRPYQATVLEKFEDYLDDSKIHLIAAPGSGKTVLGVELISRLGKPALVLVPRLSIQRQWVGAIEDLFEVTPGNTLTVSRSVEAEATITVITYQFLENLQKRWKGRSAADIGAPNGFVLVLDECHHMVGSWADTATEMIADGYFEKVVALTATPPFDAPPLAWAKYQHVCGDADYEISTAELVSHNSLCTHQDFVYISKPLPWEGAVIDDIRARRDQFENQILVASETKLLVANSFALFNKSGTVFRIQHIDVLNAFKCVAAQIGTLRQHERDYQWLCGDPTGVTYDFEKLSICVDFIFKKEFYEFFDPRAKKSLESLCRTAGFWKEDLPIMAASTEAHRLLNISGSKLHSICDIANSEFSTLGSAMRLLVLVDFVGTLSEDLKSSSADTDCQVTAISAFSSLFGRFGELQSQLAMVTGEICIVPHWLASKCSVESYDVTLATTVIGERHAVIRGRKADMEKLVAACTDEMRVGGLKILVGTASLLGEGWDCAAINCLVIASQIGSFVTSNQMRGRAIRIDPKHPDKVANIWHLLTITGDWMLDRNDFYRLSRRFDGFVAPHRNRHEICSGLSRIGISSESLGELTHENAKVLKWAGDRRGTARAWKVALSKAKKGEIAQHFSLKKTDVPLRFAAAFLFRGKGILPRIYNPILAFYHSGTVDIKTLISQRLAKRVITSLCELELLREPARNFKIKFSDATSFTIRGGNLKDQAIIADSIIQLFCCGIDTRYVLKIKLPLCHPIFLFVPKRLDANKATVEVLQRHIAEVIGATASDFLGGNGQDMHLDLIQRNFGSLAEGFVTRRLWV